jgi:hypothetical protein
MIRIDNICWILFALTLVDIGITISLADVSGSWNIVGLDAESMSLTQAGNHVYGTYSTHHGQGNIDGIMNAQNVWVGSWSDSGDSGCFSAIFSNESHLYGSWVYDNPDCPYAPDYVGNLPHDNYYCPCLYRSGGDGYFQGDKIVTGNATNVSKASNEEIGGKR